MVDDKHVTDIKTKANIFKEYFAEQCTRLKSNTVLPINQTLLTQSRFTYLDFNEEEILKIIRTLNIDKSHGQEDFFRIIRICDKSLLKALFFFKIQLSHFISRIYGKRSNITPVQKKNDKQVVETAGKYTSYPYLEKFLRK